MTVRVRIQERRNERCSNWQDSPCASVMDAWESNQHLGWDKYRWEYEVEPVAIGFQACEYPNCDRRCMQTVNGTGLCNWHATEYQADLESHGRLICCKCMWVVSEDGMGNLVDPSGSTSCEGNGVHRLSDDWPEDDEENEALMRLRAKAGRRGR